MHGAEAEEPLNSCFYSEDTPMLSCLATQGEQGLGSGNQKMARFPSEKALQTSLPHQLLPGFPVPGKHKSTE